MEIHECAYLLKLKKQEAWDFTPVIVAWDKFRKDWCVSVLRAVELKTSEGQVVCIQDGSTEFHNVRFCPFCGRKLEEVGEC